MELAAIERLEKSHIMGEILITLVPSFFDGSSSFLQVTRITIKAWISMNFGQIPLPTTELDVLGRLKILCTLTQNENFNFISFNNYFVRYVLL